MAVPPADLIDQLSRAAVAAIAAERPAFERGPGEVRGLVLEISLRRDGQLGECTAFVERRLAEGRHPVRSREAQ